MEPLEILIYAAMAVAIAPVIGLAVWYHRAIRRTEGGRRLMRDQTDAMARPEFSKGARGMLGDINAGAYGGDAKALQKTVMWGALAWLVWVGLVVGAVALIYPHVV